MKHEAWAPTALPLREKVAYGVGSLAFVLPTNVLNFYFNYFMLLVAQLPPGSLVVLGVVTKAVDVIANLIVTPFVGRTNTKWGRLKPWILGGSMISVPSYLLMWVVPDTGAGGKLAYYLVIYIIMSIATTVVTLGLRTLIMYMSDDTAERDSAVGYRTVFETVGFVIGIGMQGLIVSEFGGSPQSSSCANSTNSNVTLSNSTDAGIHSTNVTFSNSTDAGIDVDILREQRTGYLVAAGSVCGCCVLAVVAALLFVTERKDTVEEISTSDEPLMKTLRIIFTFKPFIYSAAIFICYDTMGSTVQQGLALFIEYSLDLGELVQTYLIVTTVSIVVGVPVTTMLLDKFGRKSISIGVFLVYTPLLVGLLFIPGNVATSMSCLAFMGVCYSPMIILPWVMLPDVLDEFKLQTGKELDTYFYGAYNTIQKLGTIAAALFITASLEISGYKTGACSQPESVGSALRIAMSMFPLAVNLLSAVFIWKYPITEDSRQRTKEALEQTQFPKMAANSSNVSLKTLIDARR